MYEIKENTLTPQEFRDIWFAVGWIPPATDQIAQALEHSACVFTVCEDGKVIAMGRLLGDMAMTFYVKDFAVLPEYQGKGVGRLLILHMQDWIKNRLPKGWKFSLELISSKGKEGFYSKFGFEIRPNEWDGAGMFMMLDP